MTSTQRLTSPPRLAPLLLRGAALSPLKRVKPDAAAPDTRLVLPNAPVDVRRLADYRRICDFPAQGPLPVTYPHILGFPLVMHLMAARDFPLPLLGLVHTSIEIDQRQPLELSDPLELTVYAEKLTPHQQGHGGHPGHRGPPGRRPGVGVQLRLSGPAPDQHTPAPKRPTPEPLPPRTEWRLPGDLGRRYGAASGDRNPIHLHPLTASPSASRAPSRTACGRSPAASPNRAPRVPAPPAHERIQGPGPAARHGDVRGRGRRLRAARRQGRRPPAPHRRGVRGAQRGADQRSPPIRFPRPAQAKFISVAAASFAETPGVTFAHADSDSAAPTSASARPATSRSGSEGLPVGLAGGLGDKERHEGDDLLAHHGDFTREGLTVRTRLTVQHRPAVGVLGGVREERPQPRPQLPVGRPPGGDPAAHGCDQRGGLPADARGEELFLGVQIQVHQRLRDPGELGDLIHGGGPVPALPEGPHRGVHHLLLPHGPRHPLCPSQLPRRSPSRSADLLPSKGTARHAAPGART